MFQEDSPQWNEMHWLNPPSPGGRYLILIRHWWCFCTHTSAPLSKFSGIHSQTEFCGGLWSYRAGILWALLCLAWCRQCVGYNIFYIKDIIYKYFVMLSLISSLCRACSMKVGCILLKGLLYIYWEDHMISMSYFIYVKTHSQIYIWHTIIISLKGSQLDRDE